MKGGQGNGKKPPPQLPLKPSAPVISAETVDERRAARNVEKIRGKLSAAMDDPLVREQIVRAMRELINEDKT
jgi:hypothetical protein